MEGFRATLKPLIDYKLCTNWKVVFDTFLDVLEPSSGIWHKDLEACMVDSFALEMLPELVLDERFFVLA
ncbi:hypothetical protein Tco_0715203 [Tanacetum coccineum]